MKTLSILLAAGKGTRMHSNTPKVLHKICGQEMIQYVLDAVGTDQDNTIVVVGHGAEDVQCCIGERAHYVWQENPQGTGHAVMQARDYLAGEEKLVLIVAGDMPLLRSETIQRLCWSMKEKEGVSASVLTVALSDPSGYGRVLRREGVVVGVVEERDATEEQKAIHEVNTSVYCFRSSALCDALAELNCHNDQNEYYLTDCIAWLANRGDTIVSVAGEAEECIGVNDQIQLANINQRMQKRINEAWMRKGVQMISPQTVWIDPRAELAPDVILYPNNVIEGKCKIDAGTVLHPGNYIEWAQIGCNSKIGPNAHLRKGAKLGHGCRVGNFVELKNVTLGDGAKVSHLAYCGDGDIGARANISCGVIFSNYNGATKAQTCVGDDAFVGCNANLIAPVHVGDGAYIAAGSTITDDVPNDALAIARTRQTNKKEWCWLERIKGKK